VFRKLRGGKKLSRGFTAYDRGFDTNVMKRDRETSTKHSRRVDESEKSWEM
jgi:hypothetical protein